jgi:hypothetical protein
VHNRTPCKLAKSFQFGAGLLPNFVPLSSALTYYYGKDIRIAFSSRKKSFFVAVVTVINEIGEKLLRKIVPTFVNRSCSTTEDNFKTF